MATDLLALIAVELGRTDALDQFIGSCLCAARIWDHPRASDGISAIRVFERDPNTLRIAGHIWEINQSLHMFWLELDRDEVGDRFAWALYFDVIETSARRARNALTNLENADELEWRAKLAGEAMVDDDKLTTIHGSTRVEVQDVPERVPPPEDKWRRPGRRR